MGQWIDGGVGGVGNTQIIGGKPYVMYSPQWYDAMRQNKIINAQTAGTAAGSGARAALDALGQVVGGGQLPGGTGLGPSGSIPRIGMSGGGTPDFSQFDSPSSGSGSGSSAIPQISMPDFSARESAAYGAAKDKVGQETQGGLTALRSALAGRGMLGSGAESRGTVGVITKGQGELGQTDRSLAEQRLADQLDISKANLGAGITGRGQDIAAATARRGQNIDFTLGERGQDVTQRGQDIQQQEANAQLQLTQSLQAAAQRQALLNGIMSAVNVSSLY